MAKELKEARPDESAATKKGTREIVGCYGEAKWQHVS